MVSVAFSPDTSTAQAALPVKRNRKLLRAALWLLAVWFVASLIFTLFSPRPVSFMIRAAFMKSPAVAPDHYDEIKTQVEVVKNASYPSKYPDNTADVYIPKDQEGPFPVVLWVHGGAFVGGDKSDIQLYATALAAEGIAVVCMNYRRAPEAQYPAPVIQTGETYLWIREIADAYSLDLHRFVLAGDSAGAHITAQFAAIQSNPAYAEEMGFAPVVPLDTLKAVLLFCGPFDVGKMGEGSNSLLNFFVGRAAWAYFGTKDWVEDFSDQATIANHVTDNFPPAFISDGNALSFEEQGRALSTVLKEKGVPVETYFIHPDREKTAHEYQFVMNTSAGKESFQQTVSFLKKHAG